MAGSKSTCICHRAQGKQAISFGIVCGGGVGRVALAARSASLPCAALCCLVLPCRRAWREMEIAIYTCDKCVNRSNNPKGIIIVSVGENTQIYALWEKRHCG